MAPTVPTTANTDTMISAVGTDIVEEISGVSPSASAMAVACWRMLNTRAPSTNYTSRFSHSTL